MEGTVWLYGVLVVAIVIAMVFLVLYILQVQTQTTPVAREDNIQPKGVTLDTVETVQRNKEPPKDEEPRPCCLLTLNPIVPVKKAVAPHVNQEIPLVFHQTFNSAEVPHYLWQSLERTRAAAPEYTHYYYDEIARRQFIADHYEPRILQAYDMILHKSWACDLFKYCILYREGGIYMDISMEPMFPIHALVKPETTFISAVDVDRIGLTAGFVGCTSGHPVMKHAIQLCCERVERRMYGHSSLWPTGPRCLGDAFRAHFGDQPYNPEVHNNITLLDFTAHPYMYLEGTPVIKTFNWCYRYYKSRVCGQKLYHDAWTQRRDCYVDDVPIEHEDLVDPTQSPFATQTAGTPDLQEPETLDPSFGTLDTL